MRRKLFGGIVTDSGATVAIVGKNLVRYRTAGAINYAFIEPLVGPNDLALHRSGVWLDRDLTQALPDDRRAADILAEIEMALRFAGFRVD